MPRHAPRPTQLETAGREKTPVFNGFALPTSNTTYTPNQFFDVCLPRCSRGTVRVVSYVLRKTLGWCDAEGKPQRERFTISYAELETEAGVSRDMIRLALKEAEESHFIRCLRKPGAKKAGLPSVSGLYELRWDDRPEYVKDPARFRGFFAGDGNRTYIPNQFFDHVVRHESLAVVKVVGSVIRFSIGFQNKWGHRRQHVALSYQHIQNYSRMRDRKTLSQAVKHALERNYIQRVEEGFFDPDGGKLSKAAVYALRWLKQATSPAIGRKSPPAETEGEYRSENPTGIGWKTPPVDRSENPTDIEITERNNNSKGAEAAVSFEQLRKEGFDESAARAIASRYPFERVLRQIDWIDGRRVRRNRLGLLRRAIEEDWARPQQGRANGPEPELGRPNSGVAAASRSLADGLEDARHRFFQRNSPPSSS